MILLFRSSAGRGSEERRTTARDLIASPFFILSPMQQARPNAITSVLVFFHLNMYLKLNTLTGKQVSNIELWVCRAKTSTVTLSFYSSFSMSYT